MFGSFISTSSFPFSHLTVFVLQTATSAAATSTFLDCLLSMRRLLFSGATTTTNNLLPIMLLARTTIPNITNLPKFQTQLHHLHRVSCLMFISTVVICVCLYTHNVNPLSYLSILSLCLIKINSNSNLQYYLHELCFAVADRGNFGLPDHRCYHHTEVFQGQSVITVHTEQKKNLRLMVETDVPLHGPLAKRLCLLTVSNRITKLL